MGRSGWSGERGEGGRELCDMEWREGEFSDGRCLRQKDGEAVANSCQLRLPKLITTGKEEEEEERGKK